MEELGKIYREKRKKLNLSIDEVSEKTKIRPHIIAAMEDNNFSILPPVYLKSFLKTYADFLKIPAEDIQPFIDELYQEKKTSEEAKKVQPLPPEKPKATDFREIFRKKAVKTIPSANVLNYILYAVISLVILALVYLFIFTGDDENGEFDSASQEGITPDTTTVIKEEEKGKNLLSYFESDSLMLEARAVDTTWMQIEIDGKKVEEALLYPGMQRTWSASEFFVVTQGNVGGIEFYRNGTKLEPFGSPGGVVKNIKITEDKVIKQDAESSPSRKRRSRKAEQPEKKP
ncbi:MAG: helix-turn-helix domain-containing protein, partial [Candidatus Kapaibacterium sp.]